MNRRHLKYFIVVKLIIHSKLILSVKYAVTSAWWFSILIIYSSDIIIEYNKLLPSKS